VSKVPKIAPQPEDFVFSGGTGRSGTTIVGKLLGRHSSIRASKPLEIKFLAANGGLLDLTYGRRDFIEMKKRKSLAYRILSHWETFTRMELERKFRERLLNDWWDRESIEGKGPGLSSGVTIEVRNSALDEFMKRRKKSPEEAARRFLEVMVSKQFNNEGEPIWIDTSPPNIFNADRIVKLLPKAKFIHMMRDGRNTIASVLKEHWGPQDPLQAIHWWKNRIISSHRALGKVPRESVIEIQLEELAHFNRESEYERLLDFLGLEDEPKIRNYFESEVDGERVIAQKWRDEIKEPKFEAKFYKIHKELHDLGIRTALYE
jgi:hypothetical protein